MSYYQKYIRTSFMHKNKLNKSNPNMFIGNGICINTNALDDVQRDIIEKIFETTIMDELIFNKIYITDEYEDSWIFLASSDNEIDNKSTKLLSIMGKSKNEYFSENGIGSESFCIRLAPMDEQFVMNEFYSKIHALANNIMDRLKIIDLFKKLFKKNNCIVTGKWLVSYN